MKGTADSCLTSHPPPTNVGAKHTTPLPTGEGLGVGLLCKYCYGSKKVLQMKI